MLARFIKTSKKATTGDGCMNLGSGDEFKSLIGVGEQSYNSVK